MSSNGNAQFNTSDAGFTNVCLPWTGHDCTIFPYWDDLRTDVVGGTGIFTSISGTAPNRIFNIEWRTSYFNGSGGANFELRLYEGQTRFDVIYGTVDQGNASATAGVQSSDTCFAEYFCNGSGGPPTGGWALGPAGTPSPTPTAYCNCYRDSNGDTDTNAYRKCPTYCTPTATPTATATATATPTATVTPTPTPPFGTPTPRPTLTPRTSPSPRIRPTPPPRP